MQTAELEWCAEVDGLKAISWADGSLLAVTLEGHVTFHDPDTGAVRRKVEVELPGHTTAFALHGPSMTAVWATDIHNWRFFHGRAELYAASLAGETIEPVLCGTHENRVNALAIDAAGAVLVSGSMYGTVCLWDLRSPGQGRDAPRHHDRVNALELFDGERKLLTASNDGAVKVWRAKDGAPLRELRAAGPYSRVTSAAVLDPSSLVYAEDNGYAYVIDLKTGRERWQYRIHRDGMGVVVAAPAVDGFLTGDRYGWVSAWTRHAKTWQGLQLGTPGDVVDGILLVGAGRYALAWDCREEWIEAYDLTAKKRMETLWRSRFAGWNEAVVGLARNRCAFSIKDDDGRYEVVGVSLPTGKRLFTLTDFGEVSALTAAPGGAELAVGMSDGSLALCNVRSDTDRACLVGHTRPVSALRFLDKRLLLSISMDFTLRLWDVARAEALAVFGADAPLHRLAVTTERDRLILTELSGRMHFLELQRAE